jgi:hypothetical protein
MLFREINSILIFVFIAILGILSRYLLHRIDVKVLDDSDKVLIVLKVFYLKLYKNFKI